MSSFTLPGGIEVTVADGSPDKSMYERVDDGGGARATIGYKVADGDQIAARVALLGTSERLGNPAYLSRTLPHFIEWDTDPAGDRVLWCTSVTTTPYGPIRPADGEQLVHTDWLLRATYSALPYELREDGDITQAAGLPSETSLERFVSFPTPKVKNSVKSATGGTWKWADNGRDAVSATFINLTEIEHYIKWWFVPRSGIPYATISLLMNCCNSVAFGPFAVETVVFSGVGFEEIVLPTGDIAAHVTYQFTEKPYGPNFFPDKDRGWAFHELVAKDGSGNQPHPAADLRLLLRPT